MLPYNTNLKPRSQELRNNMTTAEVLLWSKINNNRINGHRFYRQKPVGDYIADFYCPKAKLVIEVDGGQHSKNENVEYDRIREKYMESLGLRILRFTNKDVLTNIHMVLETISSKIQENISRIEP